MKTDRYTVNLPSGEIVVELQKNMQLYRYGDDLLRRFTGSESWQILMFENKARVWYDYKPLKKVPREELELLTPDASPSVDTQEYIVGPYVQDSQRDVAFRVPSYMKVFTSRNRNGVIHVWKDRVGVYLKYRIEGGPEVWQQMNWPAENFEVSWGACFHPVFAQELTLEKPVEVSFENGMYFLHNPNGVAYYRRINGAWERLLNKGNGDDPLFTPTANTDWSMRDRGTKKIQKRVG